MQKARRNRQLFVMLLISAFFLPACSSLVARVSQTPKDRGVSPEARELLTLLKNQNRKLKTFKGAGRITFRENQKNKPPVRVAWIGSVPGKLRIALRSASGQPAFSFASDGQWIYLFSHGDSQFHKQRAGAATFKKYFSIPINSSDIVNILGGRIPLRRHGNAELNKNGFEDKYVLILKKRWGTILEKIYFDKTHSQVRNVEMFDLSGALMYRVEFCGMQTINEYQVPDCLAFSNQEGRGFLLDIDRYWTDVSVSRSAFVLSPPE